MDLIAYALAKKNSGSSTPAPSYDDLIPSIGENGNWYIKGVDTGIRATPLENVEVDGILKADSVNQKISVIKDGVETIVGEYMSAISSDDISSLFGV